MPDNRQLAIILFADIQGYTSIMHRDEHLASASLHRFYKELELKVTAHQGRIVNFYGDGALCIFQNPVEALHAAMELQLGFQQTPAIPVRMGLHSGTVVTEGDKVYGDSINIASRIESAGLPGAVLISKKMRDEVKNQLDFKFTSLGNFEFKNVDEPIELFALSNDGYIIPRREQMEGKLKSISLTQKSAARKGLKNSMLLLTGLFFTIVLSWLIYRNYFFSDPNLEMDSKKSIAVLPFKNLSEDQSQNYFGEGIVETIQSKLSEVQSLKIISMASTLNYSDHKKSVQEIAQELNVNNILEGSVMRDQNKVRIIVKLINTLTNELIWTETYDRDLTDIFSIQSNIAQSVTSALKTKLTTNEKSSLSKIHKGDLAAYDLYLTGLRDLRFARFDTMRNFRALQKFQKAIKLDPYFDPSFVSLANCWYNRRNFGCGDPCRDSASYYVNLALLLNEFNADAYVLKGQLAWDRTQYADSKRFYEKALEIAPNNSEAMNHLGNYYFLETDSIEKALNLFVEALTHDPRNNGTDENLNLYRNISKIYERADMLVEADAFQKKALQFARPEQRKGIYSNLGDIAILRGQFKEALQCFDSTDNENSTSFNVLDNWIFANDLAGNYTIAEQGYNRMLEMIKNGFNEDIETHTFRHRYAHILWKNGKKEEARIQFAMALQKLEADVKNGTRHSGQEYDLAGIYNFLGDKEKAFEWLEKMPFGTYIYKLAKVDPLYKDLIGTPRYEKIMAPHHEKIKKMQMAIRALEANGDLIKELKN